MPKKKGLEPPTPPDCGENSLGLSPAVLAKRIIRKPGPWCSEPDPLMEDFDPWCDPYKPIAIHYKDIVKAHRAIRDKIPTTPLTKSKAYTDVEMNLYFKIDTVHRTGSFHERSAINALRLLTKEERENGVYSASLGNWAMALSYHGQQMGVPVTVILPVNCNADAVQKCKNYGADVRIYGPNLTAARKFALSQMSKMGVGTYINGYDHPHVIAGAGTIGIEILEQLPDVDAVLIPIGGGGLIAGVAKVIKKLKPNTLIYGMERIDSCCFYKAMHNERPYATEVGRVIAVPTAGFNAFHTAQSLIDKLILVEEDWIARALAYFVEGEKLAVEYRGATGMAALLSEPNIIPELRDKNVICLVTGGNIDTLSWPRAHVRAKLVEGRLLTIKIGLPVADIWNYTRILRVVASLRCFIVSHDMEREWIASDDINKTYLILLCETFGKKHACNVKRVLEKMFPRMCEFTEELFWMNTKCPCYPKLWPEL